MDRYFDDKGLGEGGEKEEDKPNVGLLWRGSARHCRLSKEDNAEDEMVVTMRVFTIGLDDIIDMSAVRLFINDFHRTVARANVAKSAIEVKRRFPKGVPILESVKDLGVKGDDFTKFFGQSQALKKRLASHDLCTHTDAELRETIVRNFVKKADLLEWVKVILNEARACQGMVMRDELKKMKRVLRHLGHVDANGLIQMKGVIGLFAPFVAALVAGRSTPRGFGGGRG